MEITHTRPALADFTSVDVYERATPDSFYQGPSVLYYHAQAVALHLSRDDYLASPALQKLQQQPASPPPPPATGDDGGLASDAEPSELQLPGLEIWVSSTALQIFSPATTTTLSIPYPLIGIHALQTMPHTTPPQEGLYLQIDAAPQTASSASPSSSTITLSLTLIPSPSLPAEVPTQGPSLPNPLTSDPPLHADKSSVQLLYRAMSHCSDLWPDDDDDDDDDDEGGGMYWEGDGEDGGERGIYGDQSGLPPPMPGSGGWITAENVGAFFDAEGNFRGGVGASPLGPGAGTVREREREEEGVGGMATVGDGGTEGGEGDGAAAEGGSEREGEDGVNGHGGGEERAEAKWRRAG